MWPPEKSFSTPSGVTVTRLTRHTTSSGPIGMPWLAASSGPLPQSSVARSPPSTLMFATSLEVGNPSGSVSSVPDRPLRAIQSMLGVAAASSGVRPPSSSIGSSAMPSPRKTTVGTLFIALSLAAPYAFLKRNSVVDSITSPGFTIVVGNSGWFGESGKCCVSRATPALRTGR